MNEKLEVIVNRFNDMENILRSENMKLRKELDSVTKYSIDPQKKFDDISCEVNTRLQTII